MGIKLRTSIVAGCAAACWAGTVAAQTAPVRFDVRLVPAGATLTVTALASVAPIVFASSLPHATCAPCDPSRLWGIDRGTVGAVRSGPALVSDVTMFAAGGGAGLFLLLESRGDHAMFLEDATVLVQTVATASLATNWLKVLFARPRPERYIAAAAGTGNAAASGLSFPSGHTTAAMSAAFAYWSIEARRGTARAHAPQIAGLVATAAATGVLRVLAREHFPTDVVAGAVLGAAIGWTVPRLYPVRR